MKSVKELIHPCNQCYGLMHTCTLYPRVESQPTRIIRHKIINPIAREWPWVPADPRDLAEEFYEIETEKNI